ncbi:MAG TPA: FAD-dependent oxidoreductase, partial [Thermoleophilia bacterium]|nr:FAD-dependent oxidoreductase [Thermoleophilia bacterium]
PPRIDGSTINAAKMLPQFGDEEALSFSHWDHPAPRHQVPCYLTHTTSKTHEVVSRYLHLSPLKSGTVSGKGPRYCPSIDRKLINFPDKQHHPVFVEPEGVTTKEMYLQGLTTSLPVFVQEKIIRATPGLEDARLVRPGYAVEYDYLPPQQLTLGLQTKCVVGLFCAGQLNGTSGYEEAAAQGLMAGINAARLVKGDEPFILRRDQAYIGVLIDDLVTKGVDEPYRMFTSRAEYRLLLRHDNAAERLSRFGHALGLISESQLATVEEKERRLHEISGLLDEIQVRSNSETDQLLEALGTSPLEESQSAAKVLRRPQISFQDLLGLLSPADRDRLAAAPPEVVEQLAVKARYEGYIRRQLAEIRRHRATETMPIPGNFDFAGIEGLTFEAKDKLHRLRPATLGQASRIPGVSPADVSVLLVHLHRAHASREVENEATDTVFQI